MEQQKSSPEILSTRSSHLKVAVIGKKAFLFDKYGLSVRKNILIEKNFKRAEFKNGSAVHLDSYQSFKLHDKMLTITAKYHLTYGPLGDRLNVEAKYDGESIGKYAALRSYMGGGSNGNWPQLIKDEWQLIILFELQDNKANKRNHFSVNYFETLIPYSKKTQDGKKNSIREENINADNINERFTLDDIKSSKIVSWEQTIYDKEDTENGKLICYRYPGFQRYWFNRYGKIPNWKEHVKNSEPFISREMEQSDCLYTLEYVHNGNTDIFLPWSAVEILGKY